MARRDRIYDVVKNYGTSDLVSIVSYINSWDGSMGDQDWRAMDMWDIWQNISDSSDFASAMQAAADGDFDPRDDYYRWNGYDLESSDNPDFDLWEIADWIDDHFDRLDDAFGSYYASDFDFEESEIDVEEFLEELDLSDDAMSVDDIAATILESAAEGITDTANLSPEQIHLLAKVIAEHHTCLDPADVIAAVDEHYQGAA